jgi:hypothetical protein
MDPTTTLVKVKSHCGCQLNEMADELADMGCASDQAPICPGLQNAVPCFFVSGLLHVNEEKVKTQDTYYPEMEHPIKPCSSL